jgi:histone H3/H4
MKRFREHQSPESIMERISRQASNMKLKLTKEPVTRLARATRAPEPLGSLTWCYVSVEAS